MGGLPYLNSFIASFINYDFLLANPWIIAVLALWALPWKGMALWKSAKRNELAWFVVLLLVNTVGILEIIYLLYVRSKEKETGIHT